MVATTEYANGTIPQISLHNFENRMNSIIEELIQVAQTDGFFTLINSDISETKVEHMFSISASFFALPDKIKAQLECLNFMSKDQKNCSQYR